MKKIVILLLLLSVAVFYRASGQVVPSVPMCTPVSEDFWTKASVNDLVRMIEQNHSEADKAYVLLLEKHQNQSRSYKSFWDWDDYTRRIFKTPYKHNFKEVLLQTGLEPNTVQDVENLQILINNLSSDDMSPVIQSIITNLTTRTQLHDDQLYLLKNLFDSYTDSLQREEIFVYYQKNASNQYMELIMNSYPKGYYWHEKALTELLERPSVSSSISYLIQKFPLYVKKFWEKAYKDNICFKEEDIALILMSQVPRIEEGKDDGLSVPVDSAAYHYLVSVQNTCLDELEKSGVFNNMEKTRKLAGRALLNSFIDSFCEHKLAELVKTRQGSLYDYVVILSQNEIFSWSGVSFSDSTRLHAASSLHIFFNKQKNQNVSIDTLIKCWESLYGYANNKTIEKELDANSMLLFEYIYQNIAKCPKDDVLIGLKKIDYQTLEKFTKHVVAAQKEKYWTASFKTRNKMARKSSTSWEKEENIKTILNIFHLEKT